MKYTLYGDRGKKGSLLKDPIDLIQGMFSIADKTANLERSDGILRRGRRRGIGREIGEIRGEFLVPFCLADRFHTPIRLIQEMKREDMESRDGSLTGVEKGLFQCGT
jgi:hypothetical protein